MATVIAAVVGLFVGGAAGGVLGAIVGAVAGAAIANPRFVAFFAGRQVTSVKAAYSAGQLTKAAEIVKDASDGKPMRAVLGVEDDDSGPRDP